MLRVLCTGAMVAAIATVASAQSITTIFSSNNNGSPGGAVYFDVVVNSNALTVTGFDTNTASTASFGFTVFMRTGTSVGFEGSSAGWTQVATGTGTGMGTNNASPVTLGNTFNLGANATWGLALVMDASTQHFYSGTGTNPAPGQLSYANADLTLNMGSATNVAFSGSAFRPRVWNGTMYYTAVPEPATMAILGLGVLPLLRRRRARK